MIDSNIDKIKSRIDVVDLVQSYIRLQKAGNNYKACCPFHHEKTPSFYVSPERQIWHCFGCGLGGSIFDFVMQMEGVEFGDALRILAKRAGVELAKVDPQMTTKRTRLYDVCELATRFFEKQLQSSKSGNLVQRYLTKRGLSSKTISDWRLGFAPDKWSALFDFLSARGFKENEIINAGLLVKKEGENSFYDRFRNRIIFPIFDLNGIIVGFSGRIFDPENKLKDKAKYINTPNTLLYDKSKILYGLDRARLDIKKETQCVLVEGQMDVLMLHQAGFKNIVATSGTALTYEHLKIIKRYADNLITCFDMDLAGETATKRSIDLAIQSGFNVRVITLGSGKDPAEALLGDNKIWIQALEQSQSIVDFYFSTAFSKFDSAQVEGKKNIARLVLPIIKQIPNQIEKSHWLQNLSQKLRTDEKNLTVEMEKISIANLVESKEPEKIKTNIGNLNLAQHILGLFLAYPKEMERFKTHPLEEFSDANLAKIFENFKKTEINNFNFDNFQKKLDPVLASLANQAFFRIETMEKDSNFKPEEEAIFCLDQLKRQHLQKKLNELSLDIKEAEQKKDLKSLKKLTEKFCDLSQKIISENNYGQK